MVVHGKVFTTVKRCPFCLLKNCDDNPIPRGPWGFQNHTFLIWDRGTSEAPVGRFCRICALVWVQAGFDSEFRGPDEFLEKRKLEPNRQTEFDAARTPRIQIAKLNTRINKVAGLTTLEGPATEARAQARTPPSSQSGVGWRGLRGAIRVFESVQLLQIPSTIWHHAWDLAIRVFETVQLLQISCSNVHHAWGLAIRGFESVQLLQIPSAIWHHAWDLAIRLFESVQLLQISSADLHHAWDLAIYPWARVGPGRGGPGRAGRFGFFDHTLGNALTLRASHHHHPPPTQRP